MAQPSQLPIIVLGCIAIFALLIGGYAIGYIGLPVTTTIVETYVEEQDGEMVRSAAHYRLRTFPHRWLAVVYEPAASMESKMRNESVRLEPSAELDYGPLPAPIY